MSINTSTGHMSIQNVTEILDTSEVCLVRVVTRGWFSVPSCGGRGQSTNVGQKKE